MSGKGTYAVRISGVGEGVHHFSFELDDLFFASFDNPDLRNGSVRAAVELEKKAGFMALHFRFTGEVSLACDRCLDLFRETIAHEETVFVKLGDTPGELEDNVIMIRPEDHEIEVGQIMYEYIVLSLPVQRVHPVDEHGRSGCDPEMLRRLKSLTIKESNPERLTDPRWDALKGIIEKNN